MARTKPQYRLVKGGKTLLHEIRINPTHKQIDADYWQFRENLKASLWNGDAEKEGRFYHLTGNNQAECGIYLPAKRWFTLQDITESKRVLKKHLKTIIENLLHPPKLVRGYQSVWLSTEDWNDIEHFKKIMRKLRVKKADLMAHLIFAAWKHENINLLSWNKTKKEQERCAANDLRWLK